MDMFEKRLKRTFKRNFWSGLDVESNKDVDLEDHFKDQIEFRENISLSDYGTIKYITKVDDSLNITLPIDDKSNLTKESLDKIKNVEEEKIVILIEHNETGAIFAKLFDKPKADSWEESKIKNLLYKEGVTADSLEDIIDTKMRINIKKQNVENRSLADKFNMVLPDRDSVFMPIVATLLLILIYSTYSVFTAFLISIPFIMYLLLFYLSMYRFQGDTDE